MPRIRSRAPVAGLVAIALAATAPQGGAAPPQPVVPVLGLTKASHSCARPHPSGAPACVVEIAARAQRLMRARGTVRRAWVATTAGRAGEVSPGSPARARKVPLLVALLTGRFPAGGPRSARYGPFRQLRFAIERRTGRVRSWTFVPVGGSPAPPLSALGRPRPF